MIKSIIVLVFIAWSVPQLFIEAAALATTAAGKSGSDLVPNKAIPEPRIVGGVEAKIGAWPFAAILSLGDYYFCGASVLSNKWILTAGHCVETMTPFEKRRLRVTLGEHDITVKEGTEQIFNIEAIIRNPDYDEKWYLNDLALIKLKGVANFNQRVGAITLPPTGVDFSGQNCTVIGWGATKEGGDMSNTLRQVSAPILSESECTHKYDLDFSTELCANHAGKHQDSCQGDSGGALFCSYQKSLYIVGIVSYGEGCSNGGVYTRVSAFNSWIQSYLSDQ